MERTRIETHYFLVNTKRKNDIVAVNESDFRMQMSEYFKLDPELSAKILNKEYTIKQLTEIVKEFNQFLLEKYKKIEIVPTKNQKIIEKNKDSVTQNNGRQNDSISTKNSNIPKLDTIFR